MHLNNRKWLEDCKKNYPDSFKECCVLEIGSQNVNGTIRDYFEDTTDYVGVDRERGEGVDIVCDARKTEFDHQFDTLMIISVFEHDLSWKDTLKHNLQWLKKGGMCFISFGAEGNLQHMDVWQPVPHKEVLDECKKLGLVVVDSFFEEERYGKGDDGIYNIICEY